MNTHDGNHDEPMFMAISDDDEALLAAVQMAKETLPHFKAAFSKSQYNDTHIEDYSVKYRSLMVVALVFAFSGRSSMIAAEESSVPKPHPFGKRAHVVRQMNGDLVAACRTDYPERFAHHKFDHFGGLAVSISEDEGETWSDLRPLYEWGRHHPSMVLMPNGDIDMHQRRFARPSDFSQERIGCEHVSC